VVLARDLYEQHAQGDEPEPIEVVPWSTDKLEQLHRRPDFTEARSIAAVYLVRRFLDQELGKSGMDRSFPQ
jgi:ADP-ribose diphosphatase